MALRLAPGTAWADTLARAVAAAPEAFDADTTLRNLVEGGWHSVGTPVGLRTPVDNTVIAKLSAAGRRTRAAAAVASAADASTAPGPRRRWPSARRGSPRPSTR